MSLTDYHLYTPLCHHATGWPIDYTRAAAERGLTEIGFSDHSPFPEQFDDWRMALSDLMGGTTLEQLGPNDLVTLGVAAKRVHWPVFAGKPAGLPPDLAIYRLKPARESVSDLSALESADDESPQA